MKKHIAFLLLLSLSQSHASSEFTKKWISRGSSFVYWNLMIAPAFDHVAGQLTLWIARKHLKENTPDLQTVAPESYQQIQDILKRENMPSIEGFTLKKLGADTPGVGWSLFGNKLIAIPESEFVQLNNLGDADQQAEVRWALKDPEEAAAALCHEMEHARKSHIGKRMCLSIATTVAMHMLSNKVYHKFFPAPAAPAYPAATASLARIPMALIAATAVDLIDRCYLRQTEYEADAVLKKSPYLAQKQLQYLNRTQLLQEQKFEKETRDTWENVRSGKPSKAGILSWLLAKNMSQSSYLAFQWRMYNFLNSHPCVADRAKNLGL